MNSASSDDNIVASLEQQGAYMPEDLHRMQQVFNLVAEKLEIPKETAGWHALAKQVVAKYDSTASEYTLFYDILIAFIRSLG